MDVKELFVRFGRASATKALTWTFMFISILLSSASISQIEPFSSDNEKKIYSVVSGAHIGFVSSDSRYNVIRQEQGRLRVQFLKPTVRGWVSKQYVTRVDEAPNNVRVNADVLNFRAQPSLNSGRITQLYFGYQSPVLDERDGFLQVLAPASLEVLLSASPSQPQTKSNTAGINSVQPASSILARDEPPVREAAIVQQESVSVSSQELAHLIAPGDSLSLLVYGEPDLSVEGTRVGSSGEAVFPLIGAVQVSGKTTRQVTQQIVAKLSQGYVRNPRVAVSIASYRPVFVRGEIAQGTIPYTEGLTVTKVISLAGGLKSTSRADGISVIRNGQTIASSLNASSDFVVLSGDIIDVSADNLAKDAEKSFIYLHGEVQSAGEYLFRPGLTVEKAVVLAGGFTIRASKKKVRITRYFEVEEGEKPTILDKVKLYEPIKPGDVIQVGASWF